jgi:uncharacterized repeat protein (TIGR03803 family)
MIKFNWSMRACGAFLLWAATAIALPAQTFTTLHNFNGDGAAPYAGLIQGTDGNFYGTTQSGGTSGVCGTGGCGTVFKITPSGGLSTLHSFVYTDGFNPSAGLVLGANGEFYGTTRGGGTDGTCGGGCGTVFKITQSGNLTSLHSFDYQDGIQPVAGLVQGTDGNFYGTTQYGGTGNSNGGTVFQITSGGALNTIYNFCTQGGNACTDGSEPNVELAQGTDGNFYGTTIYGGTGTRHLGTVFSITSSGALTTLHSFCLRLNKNGLCKDGRVALGALVQGTNGTFYGTTSGGGNTDTGTVFSLSVGLGPFVETNPRSGKVGASVKILGTNLTGATSVTFNGTTATFTVKSKSEITTAVPTGATTGPVQVVTPGGTLSSNVPFRVMP